jgi:hypothetical protein
MSGLRYTLTMDIEEFVKNVLSQITNSVNKNTSGEDIIYRVDYNKGVDFDLAVTTVETRTEEKGVSGGIKIKVVGAEGSKGTKTQNSSEQTSRVQFNVNLRKEPNPQLRI